MNFFFDELLEMRQTAVLPHQCCQKFSDGLIKVSFGILISSVMQKVIGHRSMPEKLILAILDFELDHQYFHAARFEPYAIHRDAGH